MIELVDRIVCLVDFVCSSVDSFVYWLNFVGDILYFEILDFVEVFVYDTLLCMVQKYLVDNNLHHLMINNLMCDMVFVVYSYFVGKMDNFHYDLERDMESHGNLLNLMMLLENLNFVKKIDFAYVFGEDELFLMGLHNYNCVLRNYFWLMFFVCVLVCHWSLCLIIHM